MFKKSKLANVYRFSKLFHQVIRNKILYVHITMISTSPAICCYTTLWKSKIQKMLPTLTESQQTVDMFPRTLWGLDLTFNSSQTDCLKTAHTDWLTNILKFVRRRLESTAKHCCIMVIFSPWLSLHHLLTMLYIVCFTHI